MKLMSRSRTRARAAPAGLRLERSSRGEVFSQAAAAVKQIAAPGHGRPAQGQQPRRRPGVRPGPQPPGANSGPPGRGGAPARPDPGATAAPRTRPVPGPRWSRPPPGPRPCPRRCARPGGVQGRQKPLRVAEGVAPQGQEEKPRQAQQQQGGHLLAQAVLPGGQPRGRRRRRGGLGLPGTAFLRGAVFGHRCRFSGP